MNDPETRTGGRRPHGELKRQLLAALLRADGPLTARELRATFGESAPALSTVLTVLDRLRLAGQVDRADGTSGELVFSVAREESRVVARSMIENLLRSSDREGALLGFAGGLDTADLELLRAALARREDPA